MRKRITEAKNLLNNRNSEIRHNTRELKKLLYSYKDRDFERKLEEYGTDLIIPYFHLQKVLIKAIEDGNEKLVYRCCKLKKYTHIDDAAAEILMVSSRRGHELYMKSPMHFAAQCGRASIIQILANYYSVSDPCKYLIDSLGCYLNIKAACFEPLHFASSREAVNCLVQLGAYVDALSAEGTPFYKSIKTANIEVLTALYEAGADINYVTKSSYTSLLDLRSFIYSKPGIYTPVLNLLFEFGVNPFVSGFDFSINHLYFDIYQKPVILYAFKTILVDSSDFACVSNRKFHLANALKLSTKFSDIKDVFVINEFKSMFSSIIEYDKCFFRQTMPDLLNLGLACKSLSNAILGKRFKLEMGATTFLPREVLLYIFSQEYRIQPNIIGCIMSGSIVAETASGIER